MFLSDDTIISKLIGSLPDKMKKVVTAVSRINPNCKIKLLLSKKINLLLHHRVTSLIFVSYMEHTNCYFIKTTDLQIEYVIQIIKKQNFPIMVFACAPKQANRLHLFGYKFDLILRYSLDFFLILLSRQNEEGSNS